jgi:hypothetical protein
MSVLIVLVAIGAIVFVIGQQVVGTAVGGKRLILLPAALTVVGIVELASSKTSVDATSVALLVLSAVIAIAIGVGLGAMTRLERRNGHLWTQLPKRGLWLWGGLFLSRALIAGIANVSGAHLAAGTAAILLVLGLNRAAQSLVVVPRAVAAGIPFAPDRNGRVFGASLFSHSALR